MPTTTNSINLHEILMFIYMQKRNPLYFLEIIHSNESCNLIGWEHFGRKLEIQNFQKMEKAPFLAHSGSYCPFLDKIGFFEEVSSVTFIDFSYPNFKQKSRKTNDSVLRKLCHRRTEWTDGRTDRGEFIGPPTNAGLQ